MTSSFKTDRMRFPGQMTSFTLGTEVNSFSSVNTTLTTKLERSEPRVFTDNIFGMRASSQKGVKADNQTARATGDRITSERTAFKTISSHDVFLRSSTYSFMPVPASFTSRDSIFYDVFHCSSCCDVMGADPVLPYNFGICMNRWKIIFP